MQCLPTFLSDTCVQAYRTDTEPTCPYQGPRVDLEFDNFQFILLPLNATTNDGRSHHLTELWPHQAHTHADTNRDGSNSSFHSSKAFALLVNDICNNLKDQRACLRGHVVKKSGKYFLEHNSTACFPRDEHYIRVGYGESEDKNLLTHGTFLAVMGSQVPINFRINATQKEGLESALQFHTLVQVGHPSSFWTLFIAFVISASSLVILGCFYRISRRRAKSKQPSQLVEVKSQEGATAL